MAVSTTVLIFSSLLIGLVLLWAVIYCRFISSLQGGDDNVEPWRRVFREGIGPQLPRAALEALRHGLLNHDPRLRPGATVDIGWTPGGTGIMQACAIGYGGWKGLQLTSAADIEMFFNDVCG